MKGNQDRLLEWYRGLRQPLRRFLGSRRGVPQADLDDVAQEVFLRLLRFDRAELVAQPTAYLFKMAANVASEWGMRARNRRPHSAEWLSDLSTDWSPNDELQQQARDRKIACAIDQLPSRARAMLRMHFEEGMTHVAMAERLNITPRMVKREMIRSYAALRLTLGSDFSIDTPRSRRARDGEET